MSKYQQSSSTVKSKFRNFAIFESNVIKRGLSRYRKKRWNKDGKKWNNLLWCLLQMRESCQGCPPWRVAGSSWEQNWGRRVRWSVHQDYDYIATTPGMVHRYHYLPQLRRYPGMSTLVATRPRWSPPSPGSVLPVLRSATSPSTPAIINKIQRHKAAENYAFRPFGCYCT